jgi:hypothetical protein
VPTLDITREDDGCLALRVVHRKSWNPVWSLAAILSLLVYSKVRMSELLVIMSFIMHGELLR